MATASPTPLPTAGYPRTADPTPRTPRARRRRVIADACFLLLLWMVLVGTNPLQEWVLHGEPGSGDAVNQVIYSGLFLLLLLGQGVPTRRELLCVPLGLAVAIGYCFVSLSWSIVPLIGFRRAALTAMTVWMVFRIVRDLGPDRTLKRLRQMLVVLLILNFLTVYLTPFGIHNDIFSAQTSIFGNWRGIVPHKNVAGAMGAVTVLLFLFDNRQFRWPTTIAVLASTLVFLYFADARTSQAMMVVGLVAGLAIRPYDANYRGTMVALLLLGLAIGLQLLSINMGALTRIVNDPTALTGRGAIWPLLIDYAGQHPWTGTGFGSFWQVGPDSPIWALDRTSGWVARSAPHGHNGYLDLLVTLGFPGLILIVATAILWPLLQLLLSQSITKPRRSLLLAMLIFCAGHNLAESSLFNAASVVQVFLLITIAIIHYESVDAPGLHQQWRRRIRRLMRTRARLRPA